MSKVVKKSRRWALVLGAAVVTAGGLVTAVASSNIHSHGVNSALSARLISASSSSACGTTTSIFCMQGGATSAPIVPGGGTQTLPLKFFNPYNLPLKVISLQVSFAGIPAGCVASAFQINTIGAAGSPPSVTFAPMVNSTTPLVVPQAGPTAAGSVSFTAAQLGLQNLTTNQDACQGATLTLAYNAQATFVTSGCITSSQNGLNVPSGQVVCISKTGKVTNGINVKSGGILLVDGGSVTGGIKAAGAAGINLCGASISGGITISGSTGEVVLGDGQGCAGNSISNGLSLGSNADGVQVIGNNVTGGFTANNNTGSIPTGTVAAPGPSGQYIEKNSGSGGMSCSGNDPAPVDGGIANTITGARSGQCGVGF